jgi:ATP-dependent RNA helicase SUPV3L1/SUV3
MCGETSQIFRICLGTGLGRPCTLRTLCHLLFMSRFDSSAVTAVLGPTNTGKTHLAVERLCAHSSGIMGFPLRLLAREIYDRVVAIKGPKEVGLITGEERIMPPGARWLLSTVESMPIERDVAFVAIDEAQLAADREFCVRAGAKKR